MSKEVNDKVRGEWKIPFTNFVVKMEGRGLTPDGAEVPDPVPLEPPVGFVRRPSLTEQIRDMVRSEAVRAAAESQGMESFEEADDFSVEDDDPSTPYEAEFEPVSEVLSRAATEHPQPQGEAQPASQPGSSSPQAPAAPAAPASPQPGVDPSPSSA